MKSKNSKSNDMYEHGIKLKDTSTPTAQMKTLTNKEMKTISYYNELIASKDAEIKELKENLEIKKVLIETEIKKYNSERSLRWKLEKDLSLAKQELISYKQENKELLKQDNQELQKHIEELKSKYLKRDN